MKLLIAIAGVAAVALVGYVGFFEGRKAYWDREVSELCKRDGGDRVFSSIEVSKDDYLRFLNKFGKFEIPLDSPDANVPVVQKRTSSYVRRNDPEVRRDETQIIQKRDGVLLAQTVSYSRVGGDSFGLQPTYHSCPEQQSSIYSRVVGLQRVDK